MVDEARSWIGTPYILGGAVKGAGTDCARIIAECLIARGIAPREKLGLYSHDWFQHTSNERYLVGLGRHARKTLEAICMGTVDAKPGMIALFRVVGSKRFNHGGIITKWPFMIHAAHPCVKEVNCVTHWLTAHREMCLFDPWSNE